MKHLLSVPASWPGCAPALALALVLPLPAMSQSSCSSDGRPRPAALVERFINADCASCWADPATPQPRRAQVALDWIVPGARGNDAPLSAAATRDSLARLKALDQPVPPQSAAAVKPVTPAAGRLRVAHGLPFNGYIGTSIEMKPAARGDWTYWLALVETIPAGAEGTPVERNLVRNLLQGAWALPGTLSKEEQKAARRRFFEPRAMAIPEGARHERLRMVGWVQDANGRIRLIAQSACVERP